MKSRQLLILGKTKRLERKSKQGKKYCSVEICKVHFIMCVSCYHLWLSRKILQTQTHLYIYLICLKRYVKTVNFERSTKGIDWVGMGHNFLLSSYLSFWYFAINLCYFIKQAKKMRLLKNNSLQKSIRK